MQKTRLAIDRLIVESFDAGPAVAAKGTVHAHSGTSIGQLVTGVCCTTPATGCVLDLTLVQTGGCCPATRSQKCVWLRPSFETSKTRWKMVKKLALSLEDLAVSSFETDAAPGDRGTVRGHDLAAALSGFSCLRTNCLTVPCCPLTVSCTTAE